ncbi:uncharacterized protein PV07_10487 [Cladophialophora immunda]|uniref:Uncharacterized protein n=1 Tax=Cladophialophora immunda TaxID=569365 RepID=A0A0D1ZAQ7_9EURO|nr:uncharacterized protein PV07_10487 [Cladophialophora immunda]KIW24796.1 hypothetical protein PV07_10487 [Cladophialophora immunda]
MLLSGANLQPSDRRVSQPCCHEPHLHVLEPTPKRSFLGDVAPPQSPSLSDRDTVPLGLTPVHPRVCHERNGRSRSSIYRTRANELRASVGSWNGRRMHQKRTPKLYG